MSSGDREMLTSFSAQRSSYSPASGEAGRPPAEKECAESPATPPRLKALTVDWTPKGAVPPVKGRGQCGSCWAFSATGSMDGARQVGNGRLASVSEQQLVDCSKQFRIGASGRLKPQHDLSSSESESSASSSDESDDAM